MPLTTTLKERESLMLVTRPLPRVRTVDGIPAVLEDSGLDVPVSVFEPFWLVFRPSQELVNQIKPTQYSYK